MKVIFLDVDGVLNNALTNEYTPEGYVGISDKLVEKLDTIVREAGAAIILSSDWKTEWDKDIDKCLSDAIYLNNKLSKYNLFIWKKTVNLNYHRGKEIYKFLSEYPFITEWVVIDDTLFSDFDSTIRKHLVHTDDYYGLTDDNVKQAINILKGELNEII